MLPIRRSVFVWVKEGERDKGYVWMAAYVWYAVVRNWRCVCVWLRACPSVYLPKSESSFWTNQLIKHVRRSVLLQWESVNFRSAQMEWCEKLISESQQEKFQNVNCFFLKSLLLIFDRVCIWQLVRRNLVLQLQWCFGKIFNLLNN